MERNMESFFHYEGRTMEIGKIEAKDIQAKIPELGETTLVLQRNAKDDRRLDSADIGALEAGAAEQARLQAKDFFGKIFDGLTEDERKSVDIMVVASDTTLITPSGIVSPHKRAVETADQVISGLRESMKNFSIAEQQFLNNSATQDGGAVEVSGLRDLKMVNESPDFMAFLVKKYGSGAEFWDAYESDVEKETRLKMGAEGPEEIADRVNYALSLQMQIAREYHKANPGRRLIVWAVSHYDSMSPFIKKHVTNIDLKTYLPVDQGAGITIKVDKNSKAACELHNQKIKLN